MKALSEGRSPAKQLLKRKVGYGDTGDAEATGRTTKAMKRLHLDDNGNAEEAQSSMSE